MCICCQPWVSEWRHVALHTQSWARRVKVAPQLQHLCGQHLAACKALLGVLVTTNLRSGSIADDHDWLQATDKIDYNRDSGSHVAAIGIRVCRHRFRCKIALLSTNGYFCNVSATHIFGVDLQLHCNWNSQKISTKKQRQPQAATVPSSHDTLNSRRSCCPSCLKGRYCLSGLCPWASGNNSVIHSC